MMKTNLIKKAIAGSALVVTLLLGAGMTSATTANAADRGDWHHDRDDFRRPIFHGPVFRGPVFVAPRPYVYVAPGPVYYGGYAFGSAEAQGYHDGLDRGREDARDGRYFDPNNSEHYRDGIPAYRDGFRRGYNVGFHEICR